MLGERTGERAELGTGVVCEKSGRLAAVDPFTPPRLRLSLSSMPGQE